MIRPCRQNWHATCFTDCRSIVFTTQLDCLDQDCECFHGDCLKSQAAFGTRIRQSTLSLIPWKHRQTRHIWWIDEHRGQTVMKYRTWTKMKRDHGWTKPLLSLFVMGLVTAGMIAPAHAGPREQAKRIHDRLAGVPPSDAVLAQMEGLVSGGNALGAASIAMTM